MLDWIAGWDRDDDGLEASAPTRSLFSRIMFGVDVTAAIAVVGLVFVSSRERPAPLVATGVLAVVAAGAGLVAVARQRGWPWLGAAFAWVAIAFVLGPFTITFIFPGACRDDGRCYTTDVAMWEPRVAVAFVIAATASGLSLLASGLQWRINERRA